MAAGVRTGVQPTVRVICEGGEGLSAGRGEDCESNDSDIHGGIRVSRPVPISTSSRDTVRVDAFNSAMNVDQLCLSLYISSSSGQT